MATLDDDEYEIPLLDQRYFGAGIKRKRIQFVPSTEATKTTSLPATPKDSSAANKYLSIVLKKSNPAEPVRAASAPPVDHAPLHDAIAVQDGDDHVESVQSPGARDRGTEDEATKPLVCDVCKRSFTTSLVSHEISIAHQISLAHSFPPSNVDRNRKGLAVLQNQGWDPDSRLGLGAKGEGVLHPIRAKENKERAGVGARLGQAKVKEKPLHLDAGKVRAMEAENKKKAVKLRDQFYRSDEWEKYMGDAGAKDGGLDLDAFKASRRKK